MSGILRYFISDLYRPHTIWASDGPYTRVELESGTFCIIFSAVWRAKEKPFLIHLSYTPLKENEGKKCANFKIFRDFFPEEMKVERRRREDKDGVASYILSSQVPSSLANFTYQVNHKAQIYDIEFKDEEKGRVKVNLTLEDRTPHSTLGPLSLLRFFPLPVQWFVFSTRSKAKLEISMETEEGTEQKWIEEGRGHMEKNFGAGFPTAWIWMQGFSRSEGKKDGSIAIAGGELIYGINSFMVSYRSSEGNDWDFGPIGNFQIFGFGLGCSIDKVDSTNGIVKLTCTDWMRGRRIKISGKAKLDSFLSLTAPLSTGHQIGYCNESFEAIFTIKLEKLSWSGWNEIENVIMNKCALEFGGEWSHWWTKIKNKTN